MVTFSHHAVNFGAKAFLIHHIFGAKTLPFWCQIVTIKSGLVRKRDTFWCENEIFHFSVLGAKTLIFGANSRPLHAKKKQKHSFMLKKQKHFLNTGHFTPGTWKIKSTNFN